MIVYFSGSFFRARFLGQIEEIEIRVVACKSDPLVVYSKFKSKSQALKLDLDL
jgi:hypothetical protein